MKIYIIFHLSVGNGISRDDTHASNRSTFVRVGVQVWLRGFVQLYLRLSNSSSHSWLHPIFSTIFTLIWMLFLQPRSPCHSLVCEMLSRQHHHASIIIPWKCWATKKPQRQWQMPAVIHWRFFCRLWYLSLSFPCGLLMTCMLVNPIVACKTKEKERLQGAEEL